MEFNSVRLGIANGKQFVIEGKPLWVWVAWLLGVLVAAVWLPRALGFNWEDGLRVRIAGMLLQLMGVLAVMRSFDKAAFRLTGQSTFAAALTWLRSVRYIMLKRPPKHYSLKAEGATFGITLGRPRFRQIGGKTLEDRVAILEETVKQIDQERDATNRDLSEFKERTGKAISDLTAQIKSEVQAVRGEVKDAKLGDLHLDLRGLGFLIVGIILASLPEEISSLTWALGGT